MSTQGVKNKSKSEVLKEVSKNGLILKKCSKQHKKDQDIVEAAILNNGQALFFANHRFRDNKRVVLLACKTFPKCIALSKELAKDKDVCEICFEKDPSVFQYFDKTIRDNKDLAKRAMKYCPELSNILCDKLLDDKEIALITVSGKGETLKHFSANLQDDDDVVMQCVLNCGISLQFASKRLKKDAKICELACGQNGLAYLHCDETIQNNKQVAMTALLNYPYIYTNGLVEKFVKDKEFMNELIRMERYELLDLSNFKDDYNIALKATLVYAPNIYHFNPKFFQDQNFLHEIYQRKGKPYLSNININNFPNKSTCFLM